jgi:hypothetical protein
VRLTTSPPSVSRLPRNVRASTSPLGLHSLLRDSFTFLPSGGTRYLASGDVIVNFIG